MLRFTAAWLLIGLGIGCLGLRLYTARFDFSDDPTSGVLFKKNPSWQSKVIDPNFDRQVPLVTDENGFIGEQTYGLLTGVAWWALPLLATALLCLGGVATPRRAT